MIRDNKSQTVNGGGAHINNFHLFPHEDGIAYICIAAVLIVWIIYG